MSSRLSELTGGYSHDVRVDGGAWRRVGRGVVPHLRLSLMQFTSAVGHHLYDIVEHVAVPALKLDSNHFHITVRALQSFHLFFNIKSIPCYKIYLNIKFNLQFLGIEIES